MRNVRLILSRTFTYRSVGVSPNALPILFPEDTLMNNYFTDVYNKYIKLGRRQTQYENEILQFDEIYTEICNLVKLLEYREELTKVISDDISELAENEMSSNFERIEEGKNKLIQVSCQKIMHDDTSVIIEVVDGVGGSESNIFSRELLSLYRRLAEDNNLSYNCVSQNEAQISGGGVYGLFGHEGGVHRVQRVPLTERSGRVHTSTVAVCVRPMFSQVLQVIITKGGCDFD
ncbi:peptide chain release factor 1-like [Octopus sinensis]|uniref:Peptide chain release factor 1-like n=1 Tax=Octopus sinensis TaxID=2607531 RepID=A0A7E6EJD7_9MOLL|nr:peptide chain release factor 1-like [Octopus sinensis]